MGKIFKVEDILPELYEEFPEITEKSIDKICHDGISRILRITRTKEEVNLKVENREEVKFFVPMTPEDHRLYRSEIRLRRYFSAKKKQNGKKS